MNNIVVYQHINQTIGGTNSIKAKTLLYLFMKLTNNQRPSTTVSSAKKYNAIPNEMAPLHIMKEFSASKFFEYRQCKFHAKHYYSGKDQIILTEYGLHFMDVLQDFYNLLSTLYPKFSMRQLVATLSITNLVLPLECLYRDPLSLGLHGYSSEKLCDYTHVSRTTIDKRLAILRVFGSSCFWDGRIQWLPENVLSKKTPIKSLSEDSCELAFIKSQKEGKTSYYSITDLGYKLMKMLDSLFLSEEDKRDSKLVKSSCLYPQQNVSSEYLLYFFLEKEVNYIDVNNLYEYAEQVNVPRDEFISTLKKMVQDGYIYAKTHAYFIPWTIKYLCSDDTALEKEFLVKKSCIDELFNSLDVYYVLKTLQEYISEHISSKDEVEVSSQAVYLLSLNDKGLLEKLQDLEIQGILHLFTEKDRDGNMWGKCMFTTIGEQVFTQFDQIA